MRTALRVVALIIALGMTAFWSFAGQLVAVVLANISFLFPTRKI